MQVVPLKTFETDGTHPYWAVVAARVLPCDWHNRASRPVEDTQRDWHRSVVEATRPGRDWDTEQELPRYYRGGDRWRLCDMLLVVVVVVVVVVADDDETVVVVVVAAAVDTAGTVVVVVVVVVDEWLLSLEY